MKNKFLSLSILILIVSLFLIYFYSPVIFHSNDYLFSAEGDGIKSYYSLNYHVKHDPSYINFEGMNYPYSEHFFYTDGHPLISSIVKSLSYFFPSISNYSVGIINFLMLFSILLTSICLFLIFRHFKVEEIWAILFSIAVTVLSPQLFRMTGHFSLSFSFIIPLSWYLYIIFRKSSNKLYQSLIIGLVIFLWFFIHAYLGMIVIIMILFFSVFDILFDFKLKIRSVKNYLYIFLQTILPIILFQTIMLLTDSHTNRSDDPWGIWAYMANPNSVFLPNQGILRDLISKVVEIGHQKWEGWAYIGIVSSIFFIYLLYFIIKNLIIKSYDKINSRISKEWMIYLLSAFTILLYSFGIPYITGMSFLLDWFPVLKQFRSLGRFAWVFYFIFTSFTLIFLYKYIIKANSKILKIAVLLFVTTVYFFEGIPYHINVSKNLTISPNYFNNKNIPVDYKNTIEKIIVSDYQAIIPLPFFHGYSGNFERPGTNKILKLTTILSYYTSLPTVSSKTSRTSVSESKNIVQLLSPKYIEKQIKKDLQLKKPFLVIYSKEDLTKNEKLILNNSVRIAGNNDFELYLLPYDSLFYNNTNEILKDFETKKGTLYNKDKVYLSDTLNYFAYNNFDSKSGRSISYKGQGSLKGLRKDHLIIFSIPPNSLKKETEYILSLWYYNKGYSRTQNSIIVEEQQADNEVIWLESARPMDSEIIDNEWTLVETAFKINEESSRINIITSKNRRAKDSIYIDELLIRSINTDVYMLLTDQASKINELFYNGLFFKYH